MEDYSLALKKMAKFPKAFPEHHGNEEKAGEFSTQFASPNNKVLMFFWNPRSPARGGHVPQWGIWLAVCWQLPRGSRNEFGLQSLPF